MFNGRRQPSRGGTSRMMREYQVRFCERLGVKFPGPTRQKPALPRRSIAVRFTPNKADPDRTGSIRRLCHEGRPAVQQRHYSMTSSARADNVGGTSRLSSFAVFRLITNSNLVGCPTGRSAGFSPLRTRAV
jgi:hypothetical protein